jgi:hypothetical protein
MRNRLPEWMIFLSLMLCLGGCVGTLDIWGVNLPIPGDDDDDGAPPDIDFSEYDGAEYLNIRWDPGQAEAGFTDCQEPFDVSGELLEETKGCPSCDVVWAVSIELRDAAEPCLSQGTDLDLAPEYDRYLGMDFHRNNEFTLYRSTADSDEELLQLGEGAFNGLEFTWSGIGSWEQHFPGTGFTLFYSGEGDF